MWWIIGTLFAVIVIRYLWRTWAHPAAALGRQAANMGWVAAGTIKDEGYRDTKLVRAGMVSVIRYRDQNVELLDPSAPDRFNDFVELERWLATDGAFEPDSPESVYIREVDNFIRSLGYYDDLVLPAQTVESFLSACAELYKAGFETGTSHKIVGMHIADGANKFGKVPELGVLYLKNVAKGLRNPKPSPQGPDPQEEERKRLRHEVAEAAKITLRQAMANAVQAAIVNLAEVSALPLEGEALLEFETAREKWRVLRSFGQALRSEGEGADVAEMISRLPDVKVRPGVTLSLVSNGNERDGFYEVPGLAESLIYASTLEGVIAALYMSAGLVPQLAWGHGCYDRDAALIATLNDEIDILVQNVKPDRPEIAKLSVPPGIRVGRTGVALTAKCLAYRPGKGIYDFSVTLQGGTASPLQETELFKWGGGIYY